MDTNSSPRYISFCYTKWWTLLTQTKIGGFENGKCQFIVNMTEVQGNLAFGAFESQLRTLCLKEFPCGIGKWVRFLDFGFFNFSTGDSQ